MPIFYFAYGSNLNPYKMRQRCPDAKKITTGRLDGYELCCAHQSSVYGGGVFTIQPEDSNYVEGVLYEFEQEDLEAMDRFEGVPYYYERYLLRVETKDKKKLKCWVYIAPSNTTGRIDSEYLETCIAGADYHSIELRFTKDHEKN